MDLDIKPQSCPNPLNVKSKGVLPVAILGTDSFDVIDIEILSLRLVGVSPLPGRSSVEDVATPFAGTISTPPDEDSCNDLGGDGFLDLTLKFDAQEIATALAALAPLNDREALVLKLTGNLTNGTPIEGQDVVRIIKKKNKK